MIFIFIFRKEILFMVRGQRSYGSSITTTCIFLPLVNFTQLYIIYYYVNYYYFFFAKKNGSLARTCD